MAPLRAFIFAAGLADFTTAVRAPNKTERQNSIGHISAHLHSTPSLALKESLGLIDQSDEEWLLRKKIHLDQLSREKAIWNDVEGDKGRVWWQFHHEPSFHCEFSRRIGDTGDGGKWVCDPEVLKERAKAGEPCLVYSVGSHGQFDFEQAVKHEISDKCEVHIFDPGDYAKGTPEGMKYHAYPFGLKGQEVDGVKAKTMPEIVEELGHKGRRMDIFKIDCEGCEWDTYEDWFNADIDIRQILVEMHWRNNATRVQEMYKKLQDHGYVAFNKEPNTLGCGGDCIEYSFVKFDPSFNKD